jgi:hypothetical protein
MILVVILAILILGLLGLSVVGLANPPEPAKYAKVSFSDQAGSFNQSCTTSVVPCETDDNCKKLCKEQNQGVDMACVALSDPSSRTDTAPSNNKVCAIREAAIRCGRDLGGVLTWSGWADADRMDWDCLCQFPGYASNSNCREFNSGICSTYDPNTQKTKSHYNWNVSMGRPELGSCSCPNGFIRQTSVVNQMQRCVPNALTGLYKDLLTSDGYTYVGCYTDLPEGTKTVAGFEKAKSEAGASPFMAISGNALAVFSTLPAEARRSNDPVCQRVCPDNADYKCGGRNTKDNKIWAVYKKN